MTEQHFQEWLESLVSSDTLEPDSELDMVRSFEESGIMTLNKGLVIRMKDGSEFHVSIVKSRN